MEDTKIAVIADVHANIYALTAFLDFVDKSGDIDCIWNLGDFLQIGPHPREVAEKILNDPRFINVLGNNEQALMERNQSSFPANEVAHQNWTLEQIGDDLLSRLRNIPVVRQEHLGNQRVLLIHIPEEAQHYPNIDMVTCGHTHKQLRWTENGVEYVNPGSLGASFRSPQADYAIIKVHNDKVQVSLESLVIDDSKLRSDYISRRVPDAEYLMNLFNL